MKKLIEKLGEMKRMHAELCRCSRQSFPYTKLIRMTIDTTKKNDRLRFRSSMIGIEKLENNNATKQKNKINIKKKYLMTL